jgi:hypothetical protein
MAKYFSLPRPKPMISPKKPILPRVIAFKADFFDYFP